jgi:tetratricopeptide (TPR) repeat protein
MLVLDDLHWADSATMDLFEHLGFAVAAEASRRELNLLLVAGFRPVAPEHRIGRVLGRLRRESVCQTIELSGIGTSDICELVTTLVGARASMQLVRMIQETTDGNPLFIREVLAHLERRGGLRESRGFLISAVDPTELQMPMSITNAIADRAHKLSAPCRWALVLGSFLGSHFGLKMLSGIGGQSEDALVNLLDEAVKQGLLFDDGEAYHFAHPLVRHVFYHEATPTRRGRIHLQIAQWLEELAASEPELHLLQITHHLVRAGPLAEPATLIEYAGRAADQALAQFAWNEAAQFLDAAIAAAQARSGFATRDLAELHRKAGLAYYNCLDTGPCFHHFDLAIEGFRKAGDVPGFARALNDRTRAAVESESGATSYGAGDITMLEAAIARLSPTDWRLRARLLGTLAECHCTVRQIDKAERVASEAMRLASAEQDDGLCAALSLDLGLVHFQALRLDEALSSYRTGLRHAHRANDPLIAGRCLQRILLLLFMTGRLDEAQKTGLEATQLNLLTQDAGESLLMLATLASLATVRGDIQGVEQYSQEALALTRRGKYPWAPAMALAALACSRALRGNWGEAHAAIDLILEPGVVFEDPEPIRPFTEPYRQLISLHEGKPPLIVDLQPPMIPDAESGLDFSLISNICAHVEISDAAGAPDLCPGVAAALETAQSQGVVFAVGWPFLVPRIQGVAASIARHWEDAERYFVRAIKIAEEAEAGPELGRSCLDYARMLAKRGRPQDRPIAAQLIRRAIPALRGSCPKLFERAARELGVTIEEGCAATSYPSG